MAKSVRKRKSRDILPPNFSSVQEASEFWETHSIADYWAETDPVNEANIQLIRRYVHIDADLARKIHTVARKRGISTETLINLWLKEKIS
jgi:hypothetical protein